MPNELAPIEPNVQVTPTPIIIENQKAFEQAIQAVVDKYGKDFVVTSGNYAATKKMRTQINKVVKAINSKRLAVKREYDQPAKVFNSQMNAYVEKIQDVIAPIDHKLHEVEEQEKKERKEAVERLIADMAVTYSVSASDVPIRPSWLLKSATGKKVTEEIAADMKQLKKDRDQRATDIQTVTMYANNANLDPASWVTLLRYDSVSDIMKEIDQAVVKRDADAKAEAELAAKTKEAAKAVAESHQMKQGGETIDTDTGEVVPQVITVQLTGTHKALGQVWSGAKQLGVKVELVKEED